MTERRENETLPPDGEKPAASPTGLTYREQQRRRMVIAGLTAPAMITLPSRRAWSVACTKSQMKKVSGNLSAKKKIETNCDPIGCHHTFWKYPSLWPMVAGGPQSGDSFVQWFPSFTNMYTDSPTLDGVLNGQGTIRETDANGDTPYKGKAAELRALNRAAAASLLNAYYLNNMNFIIGFHIAGTTGYSDPPGTSPGEVAALWDDFVADAVALNSKTPLDSGKAFFESYNRQNCPLR